MIPNEIIDEILGKIDLAEIISAYIPLKKAGQNFKACCPFHEEKTPSFMVSPSKQIYHCFGCGSGGNAISFLMKHEKMDFVESVTALADKAGVALPKSGLARMEENSSAGMLHNANNIAAGFYQENLMGNRDQDAYRYFVQRGITEQTARLFRLGFAQDSWQSLFNHCSAKGVEPDIVSKAGLILQNAQTGNWYDRFRNRIIFPIFDMRQRVLGFGARTLDNSLPKYINSPETYIYKKGAHLYGLNFSKEYIRKQNYVIIVEGYFDLILPFQNEIRNIVATLGTALSHEQIGVLRRFTKNVIIIYDSDKAGEEATLRNLDLLISEDMNVRIAVLPKGSDPDSFIRKVGKDGFTKALKESKDVFDYKLDTLSDRFKKDDPRGKARIIEGMLPTIARINNAVLKSAYLKKMSEKLAIDEESIREELKKVKPGSFTKIYPLGIGTETPENKKFSGSFAEIALLAIALEETGWIEKIEGDLGFGSLRDESIACILKKISEFHKTGKPITPARLMSLFPDTSKEGIISEAASLGPNLQDKEKVLKDCFGHIRRHNLKETLSNMQVRIKDAESVADVDTVNRLVAEYNELIKGMK